jgi:hypothetical protein
MGQTNNKEKYKWATIEEVASAEEVAVSEDRERCTRQPAQTVVRKLKYLSSHPAIDRCTAGNATRNINQRDIKFINIVNLY